MKWVSKTVLSIIVFALPVCVFAQSGVIEEIVITAQKREQSLQDVAVAVTAFSGAEITGQGVTQAKDIAAQTPNLLTKNAVGNTAPIFSIRGLSLNDFATNGTQPVGVYLDEVYLVNNSQLSFQMFDIERVEVLKGPQGTLYGRNTTAGAVNFISRKPSDEFEADLTLTVGDYELFTIEGAIGGAISERLSGRFAFASENQGEGFFTNTANDTDHGEIERLGLRGQLLWDVGGGASVLLNVHGGRDRSDNWFYSLLANESGLPEGDIIVAADPVDGDIYSGAFNSSPGIDNDTIGVTLTVDWDLERFSIRSISSYEDMEYGRQEDFDSTVLSAGNNDYGGDLKTYSQELRISSPGGGRWDWILGAFYGVDDLDETDVFDETDHPFFLGLVLDEVYNQETTSVAVYSHNEIYLTDNWKLTAAVRYTDEERTFTGGTLGFAEVDNEVNYSEVTGRAGIDYTFSEDLMVYANYSRGYKSGGFTGFFVFVPEEKDPYNPEFINAYELGFKSDLANGLLRVNGAAFYYDYEDLQAFAGVDGFFRIFNVEEVEVYGAELDVWWAPAASLDIKAGVGLLDTEVTESTLPDVAVGNKLGNAPDFQFNTSLSYVLPVGNGYSLRALFTASYQDDVNYSITGNPNQVQGAYWLANGRLSFGADNSRWNVSIWVKNLTDEVYFGEIFSDGALAVGFPAARRTFGAAVNLHWE